MHWSRRSSQAAMVFDVNKYNVVDLFMVHTRIMELQKTAESQEERQSIIEKHIYGMLTEIPWTVGKDAQQVFEGTAVGAADEEAAELNSEELMLISAGQRLPVLDELPSLNIESMEGKNANAKPS